MNISKIHILKSRIATLDIGAVGVKKHHVAALLEVDVSKSRQKIRELKRSGNAVSFTAWVIKAISLCLQNHSMAAAYLRGKREVHIFKDVNVSLLVEKNLNGVKVPIPLLISKANEKSIVAITAEINLARDRQISDRDIVLNARSNRWESLYYGLPGFARRMIWRYILHHPRLAFEKMGNVAYTSVGMSGNVSAWFIPISIHPVCFGVCSLAKKPLVVEDRIEIREVLNMTVLMDHDVIDGSPMARFISELSSNLSNGQGLELL